MASGLGTTIEMQIQERIALRPVNGPEKREVLWRVGRHLPDASLGILSTTSVSDRRGGTWLAR